MLKGDQRAHRRRQTGPSAPKAGPLVAEPLFLSALLTPHAAAAAETPAATLISEAFDAQADPANFGFPVGAGISDGVLNVTQGMGNYTMSVRPFASTVVQEKTVDLRFDWKTDISSSAMKTGMELRDDDGRLVFAIAATASELRYAVTGPDSDSTSAPDALNPTWIKTGFDRSKWYTVDLHMDFTLGKVQYAITSKEAAPRVLASGTRSITARTSRSSSPATTTEPASSPSTTSGWSAPRTPPTEPPPAHPSMPSATASSKGTSTRAAS
jgi:hypothetical protein